MEAHAAAVEEDGWDGMFFMGLQNLSMKVFLDLFIWRFQRDVTSSLAHTDASVVEEATNHYCNYHHGLEHAPQTEAIPADFLQRFCVIGPPEECTERPCQLIGLGLSHLVIVGGSRDIDATVRERSDHLVAREVLPAVRAAFA
jgi:5,10-methylenetetrahydromethanopterin reductase